MKYYRLFNQLIIQEVFMQGNQMIRKLFSSELERTCTV